MKRMTRASLSGRLGGVAVGLCLSQPIGASPADGLDPVAMVTQPDSSLIDSFRRELQVTRRTGGHLLTNTGVWSPDSEWIVYDTRSDPEGSVFDGTTIEEVNIRTGEVRVLYRSSQGAACGVVTCHPREHRVVFIHGPENPTPGWLYGPYHRRGVLVDAAQPQVGRNLDACDLTPPFTPGALRGGSHVHVFSPDGAWVSFTYEDHVLAQFAQPGPDHELNQRNVGVSVPQGPVRVSRDHPRNHDGTYFSVLVTRTTSTPRPGSDDIVRACEEGWVGTNGYVRANGSRQPRALAFQGHVVSAAGPIIPEVFIADLPEDLTIPGDGPLAGTERRRPCPPRGVVQRRLTHTTGRSFPGIQGPRHWLRSSPDGTHIAFLMKDDLGHVQLWTVSPNGGEPGPLTRHPGSVASAFTWSPDGRHLAYVLDQSVVLTEAASGRTWRLTPRSAAALTPRPEACVFSPDGRKLAYVRHAPDADGTATHNQIFVLFLEE